MPESFSSRAAIRAHQLSELGRLFAVLPENPFYRAKLALSSACPESLEAFAQLPFTAKSELVEDQRLHPPWGRNLSFPLHRYNRCHQTSGTSGAPLRWLDTPESWQWMMGSWREIYRAAGVTAEDRICFAFSFGPFIGFWLAFEAATDMGCLCLPGGGLSSAARIRMMLDLSATVLCCTPTYAIRLGETAAAEGINLKSAAVRCIIVAGEPGGSIPATRARLQELWPAARIFDHHGMTEVGPVTYECPNQPGRLHVVESSYLAEVVEVGGSNPLAPGQRGELILTTLGRLGSPLLRYRTGDLVIAPDPAAPACVCGRFEMALEGGILGRVDDMVVVRGVNIYPAAVEELLRQCSEVAEYQVTITESGAMREMAIQVEFLPSCAQPAEAAARLETAFQVAFSLRVPVEAVPAGALPRFEMKAKRWVRQ